MSQIDCLHLKYIIVYYRNLLFFESILNLMIGYPIFEYLIDCFTQDLTIGKIIIPQMCRESIRNSGSSYTKRLRLIYGKFVSRYFESIFVSYTQNNSVTCVIMMQSDLCLCWCWCKTQQSGMTWSDAIRDTPGALNHCWSQSFMSIYDGCYLRYISATSYNIDLPVSAALQSTKMEQAIFLQMCAAAAPDIL